MPGELVAPCTARRRGRRGREPPQRRKTGDVALAERLGHRRHQLRERGLFGLDLRPQVTPALEVSEVLGEIAVEAAQDCDAALGFLDLFGR